LHHYYGTYTKQRDAKKVNEDKTTIGSIMKAEIFNDVSKAYHSLFSRIAITQGNRVKKLRIYATNSATKGPYFFDNKEITIDECVIFLRKLHKGHELYDEKFDEAMERLKDHWIAMKSIKKLTIIEYNRLSDIWYVICDDKLLLTDLLAYNLLETNNPTKQLFRFQDIQNLMLTSDEKYISQYIDQFDKYKDYYEKKGNVTYCRTGANQSPLIDKRCTSE
jgi:hypothetical protein